MPAAITEIQTAMVTLLNGGSFTPALSTVARKYLPVYSLKDLQTLTTTIVPKSRLSKRVSRGQRLVDYEIHVAVQLAVKPDDIDTLDELTLLMESIEDYLFDNPIPLAVPIKPDEIANDPIYDQKKLHEEGIFLSLLTATYRLGFE